MENKTKITEEAFRWVIEILNKNAIPFQITGGLAAKAHGSNRSLNDIDIEIPEDRIEQLAQEVKDYITFGPERYIDDNWDITFMTVDFKGQGIDICGDVAKMRSSVDKEWEVNKIDFSKSEIKNLYGIDVPVMAKDILIKYKEILGRETDKEDIKQMLKNNGK